MSTREEEDRAMRRAWEFLLALGSGEKKVGGNVAELRREAREIVKHFPLGGRR